MTDHFNQNNPSVCMASVNNPSCPHQDIAVQTVYEYIGCFVPLQGLLSTISSLDRKPLARAILQTHVTFQYMPIQVCEDLFGERIEVTITGYGSDNENEGLLVQCRADHPVLQEMIRQIPVPHITLSVSENGQAVNTRYLRFHSIPYLQCVGTFGGCTINGDLVLS